MVKQPGFLVGMTDGLGQGLVMVGTTLVLTLFLLASGRLFPEKLVHSLPLFGDKLRVFRVLRDVEREVSTYLLTITLINLGLGAAVGLALALTGMPNPAVWAVVVALLNYLPFLGAILGVFVCALVSLVTFPTVELALWPPLAYAGLTLLEGQLITPTLVGRRLAINSVAVVLAVLVWAWIWGVPGALIAVPLLVVVKVVCGHFEPLWVVGEFLSTRRPGSSPEASLGGPVPPGVAED
jgi:predicted PurR-regulated permease PerM